MKKKIAKTVASAKDYKFVYTPLPPIDHYFCYGVEFTPFWRWMKRWVDRLSTWVSQNANRTATYTQLPGPYDNLLRGQNERGKTKTGDDSKADRKSVV